MGSPCLRGQTVFGGAAMKSDPVPRGQSLVPAERTLPVPASTPEAPEPEAKERARRRWPWVVGIAAVILLAVFALTRSSHNKKVAAEAEKKKAASRQIPVSGLPARTGDLNVYLTGLGNVTA